MSGSKQHYIPQFLLRNFGERKGKRETKVFVYHRNGKAFRIATSKIAAQRHFYSAPAEDGGSTLDDEITKFENQIYTTLENVTSGGNSDLDSIRIAEAIAHLCIRQASFRDLASKSMRKISDIATETFSDESKAWRAFGLHKEQPSKPVREEFEKLYEKHQLAFLLKGFLTRESFVNFAVNWTKENFSQNFRNTQAESQRLLAGVSKLADEIPSKAHIKALQKNLAPPARVEHLAKMKWGVDQFDANSLILSDCVAIGLDADGSPNPLLFSGNAETVIAPLRHDLALVGSVEGVLPRRFSSEIINRASASSSTDFFIARTESLLFETLQSSIGSGPAARLEEIFDRVLGDLDW